MLPLLVVAHDLIAVERGERWRQRLRRWFPSGLLLVGAGLYRAAVVGGVGGYSTPAGAPAFLELHPIKTLEALLVRSPALSLAAINWNLPRGWWLQALAVLWVVALVAVLGWGRGRALSARRFAFVLGWIVLTALPAHHLLLVGGNLLGARNLYLPAAGGALLLAMVAAAPGAGRRGRWLSGAAVFVLLAFYSAALQHNLRAWKLASSKTQQIFDVIVAAVPNPPAQAHFWVVGLPNESNGVYSQRIGLAPQLNLRYGRRDFESESFAGREAVPPPEAGIFLFRWDVERRQLEAVEPGDSWSCTGCFPVLLPKDFPHGRSL